ncbi:nitroreductase [Thiomicrospira sp. ALE5]|uniref:nitroreductase family protein n=1 Tax=Thiomicrospira sp. ALE5 TaxID=748650 RepID=UPI0008E974E3|nr:nitroreductase [Thiomicrospira sp. ALE5]SFR56628.1 Nitroreductase [Thiomicrospira sp. ALE5]
MLISCIKKRRSIFQFQPQSVPTNVLKQCLEAAIWAPNHRLTEPWRFYVIGPKTHQKLASIYANLRAKKRANTGLSNYQVLYDHAVKKFMAIPQVIFVGQVLDSDPVISKEDYAACACAIQNFQLVAWELELGVQWSTGPILTAAETANLLGIDLAKTSLIAALYIGYPKAIPTSSRQNVKNLTCYYD